MTLFIGFLTVVLILDCLLLILLVLVQLPKKEAGAGLAFGGGAADALFGAGAGNPLTKITKYSAVTFFVLLVGIALLQKSMRSQPSDVRTRLEQESRQAAPLAVPPAMTEGAPADATTTPATTPETPTNVSAPAVDTGNRPPE